MQTTSRMEEARTAGVITSLAGAGTAIILELSHHAVAAGSGTFVGLELAGCARRAGTLRNKRLVLSLRAGRAPSLATGRLDLSNATRIACHGIASSSLVFADGAAGAHAIAVVRRIDMLAHASAAGRQLVARTIVQIGRAHD